MNANPAMTCGRFSALRFALYCALLLLSAIWLEPLMGPLNRATAVLSGNTIAMFGFIPQVRGDLISLSGFTVRIVSECTALYATLLLAAFILATPATWRERLAGIIAGGALLSAFNLLRIAAVTIVGALRPELFEALHVYLGQLVMLLLVVLCCLVWNHRVDERRPAGTGFVIRCLFWGSLLFFPWLILNVSYMKMLDVMVVRLFALGGQRLVIPYQHVIYYQTFNLVLFAALILSERRISGLMKLRCSLIGVALLVVFHLLFRVGNVLLAAFNWQYALGLSNLVFVLGGHLLPVFLWLASSSRGTGRAVRECFP